MNSPAIGPSAGGPIDLPVGEELVSLLDGAGWRVVRSLDTARGAAVVVCRSELFPYLAVVPDEKFFDALKFLADEGAVVVVRRDRVLATWQVQKPGQA